MDRYGLRANAIFQEYGVGGAKAGTPFFLYIAFAHTHTPLAYTPEFANASARPGLLKVNIRHLTWPPHTPNHAPLSAITPPLLQHASQPSPPPPPRSHVHSQTCLLSLLVRVPCASGKVFGNTLAEADHTVGVIVDALDANGLGDDTLVFVSSDNGSVRAQPWLVGC